MLVRHGSEACCHLPVQPHTVARTGIAGSRCETLPEKGGAMRFKDADLIVGRPKAPNHRANPAHNDSDLV
ncbi:hypothetical protein GCM10012275_14010 [Longimycelium tulufanense]|uniref:Uncharacterized protein n=1 Tax=Longimycelium tulufanense TaxID=907463 RepID=A0A8J3CBR0_9PSEU|nr:hypothetical protein GCM10012275_14010 [Longimycelium tulufanense]